MYVYYNFNNEYFVKVLESLCFLSILLINSDKVISLLWKSDFISLFKSVYQNAFNFYNVSNTTYIWFILNQLMISFYQSC